MPQSLSAVHRLASLAMVGTFALLSSCDNAATEPSRVRQIVFESYSPDVFSRSMYIIGEDGSRERVFDAVPADAGQIAWDPSSDRIVYVRNYNAKAALVIAAGGGAVQTVIGGPPPTIPIDSFVGYVAPAWSPDGTKIVFTASRLGRHELMIVNADGSGLLRLAGTSGVSYHGPIWSPDGSRLAVTTNASGGGYDIHTMKPDGTSPLSLGVDGSNMAWSPDGSRIAFVRTLNGNRDIYTIDPNERTVTRLTDHPESDFDPSWSADGSKLAFASTRDRVSFIFTMNADGSNVARLATKHWNNFRPVWLP